MKTLLTKTGPPLGFDSQRGSAVVIFLVLLGIMLVLVAANGKTLVQLKMELRLIEQRQVQRLERWQTNAVSLANPPSLATPSSP